MVSVARVAQRGGSQRASRIITTPSPRLPGTSDRVLLLSGTLHSVLTGIFLILEKISKDTGTGGGK